jgi:hypothetical protein
MLAAVLGALVAARAVEAHDLYGALDTFGGRAGSVQGLTAFALAAAAACASAALPRAPAWSTVVMTAAAGGGALAVGALWLLPALVLMAASIWALTLLPDPFALERAQERTTAGETYGQEPRLIPGAAHLGSSHGWARGAKILVVDVFRAVRGCRPRGWGLLPENAREGSPYQLEAQDLQHASDYVHQRGRTR